MRAGFFWSLSAISPLEHGAHLGEGGERPYQRYKGRLFLEALSEANKKYVDELTVFNGVAEFTEFVGDGLETLAVDANRCIALHLVLQLGMEADGAGVDIVLKQLTKG